MLNTYMNWDNILNNDAVCERAALDAAKLLDSTCFLAAMDDDSLESAPEAASNENGYFERSDERASGGAEPSSKRARLDEVVLYDLDAAHQPFNGTQDEPEKEYFELQPSTSYSYEAPAHDFFAAPVDGPSTSYSEPAQDFFAAPDDVHDILYGLDCPPSTSAASVVQHDEQPEPERSEEDQWVDFYYELEDPHADLVDKVKAQMAKSDEEIAKIDAEFTSALIEKATVDQMITVKFSKNKVYKEPGKKDHVVFVCFVCSRGFLTTEEMCVHVQESHLKAGAVRDFKCRYCRRSFAKRQKLMEHERKHEQPEAKFACEKCPAFYNTRDTLERHYSDKHGCRMDGTMIERKQLECEKCGKQFGVKKELQYHGYYCGKQEEIAEKRAAKRARERIELPYVTPASPLARVVKDKSCPVCGVVTASMQSRNRHVQRQHPERYEEVMSAVHVYTLTPELLAARPFSCPTCDKVFATQASLTQHERRLHAANPWKSYFCPKCSMGYPLASELRKHVKKNEGRLMCRARGRGDCSPSNSASTSGFSSRASSVTPKLRAALSPGTVPMMRPSSNTPISLSDAPNPARERCGPKKRRLLKKEEVEEADEMETDETPAIAADDGAVADDDDAMMDGTLDEEIAADEAAGRKMDTLDDFEF